MNCLTFTFRSLALIKVLKTGQFTRFRQLATQIDQEKLFIRRDVQLMLRTLTGFDSEIVFASKPVNYLASPRYVFMTDDELDMVCSFFHLLHQ